jgi:capsular exopolysaccharide synthesis family protein
VIGFTGTSKRIDVCDLSVQTALALANMNIGSVLLIDADLAAPRFHEIFQTPRSPGLTNIIQADVAAEQTIRPTNVPHLSIMPAGISSGKGAAVFASSTFRTCLEAVSSNYCIVVFRVPPMHDSVEALLIAACTDGVILVIDSASATRTRLTALRAELASVRTNILGALLFKG